MPGRRKPAVRKRRGKPADPKPKRGFADLKQRQVLSRDEVLARQPSLKIFVNLAKPTNRIYLSGNAHLVMREDGKFMFLKPGM